jgi:dienelactone hydrolase
VPRAAALRCLLIAILLAYSCGIARAQVPLPADLHIQAPNADVPPAVAAFVGAWGNAAWAGITPAALVVEQVAPDGTAQVIYALGNSRQIGVTATALRLPATIRDGVLTVQRPTGVAEFRITDDGELYGLFTAHSGSLVRVWLSRVPGTAAQIIATVAQPFRPIWQDIRIPEHSKLGIAAGQDIALQATLYRTALPGRQPLVVFSHGSDELDLPGAPTTYRAEAIARFFMQRGYDVIVPMRKGRGSSTGPLVEDSDVPYKLKVESGLEDLDAVVDYMAAQPWVDPTRIMLVGWSSGGFLSVVYAAHHPDKITGVINFAGCWMPELGGTAGAQFNRTQLIEAGHTMAVPSLWLYADNDHFWSLPAMRTIFAAFQENGGRGQMLEFTGIPNDGHMLPLWIDKWREPVARYLQGVDGGG